MAFKSASARCHKPFSDWLVFLSERLDDAGRLIDDNERFRDFIDCDFDDNTYEFCEIWNSSLIYLKDNSFLHEEDIDYLKTLGQTLGYLDITAQEIGIKLFLENLHAKINEISANLTDKIRISIIAGMVSGIFIVVLLV